jgi:hypothetical protein
MNKARAAQIWDQLERQLIEHCGLPNGRMLELARPGLIRRIGNALSVKSVKEEIPQRRLVQLARLPAVGYRANPRVPSGERLDTIHDPRLAAMLEHSCSRRMGYDGDDVVDYGRH